MPDWLSYAWYEACYYVGWSAFTLGWSARTDGWDNMPRAGPVLVVANHESFLDPLLVGMAVRRHLHFLARKTLFRNRPFAAFLRSTGCVPVDQLGVAKEGLKTSLDLLGSGKALLIFPEGERTPTGHMQPLKPGILLLIRRAAVPILPVGIAGAYESYPRTRLLPRLSPLFWPPTGAAVAVAVGKPIPPARYAEMQREEVLEDLSREIRALVGRAERLRRKPPAQERIAVCE
jgi:1-acyl-sn-glycerol-3-phosphate acyltransferase